jgi:hypothetical protein
MADGRLTCALEPGDDELHALLLSCVSVAPMIECAQAERSHRRPSSNAGGHTLASASPHA